MSIEDPLVLGGKSFDSRFILGSGKYSLDLVEAAVEHAGAQIITLALRRANSETDSILAHIPEGVTLLPNTSGARTAEEAVRIARLARELGCGDFVKIEIMRDSKYLLPDNYETIKATEVLANEGFIVLPYMYPDLNVARDLVSAGAAAVMPRIEQGARHERLHPDPDRRDRPTHHRRCGHRATFAGCGSHGDGGGCCHGEYRDRNRR